MVKGNNHFQEANAFRRTRYKLGMSYFQKIEQKKLELREQTKGASLSIEKSIK